MYCIFTYSSTVVTGKAARSNKRITAASFHHHHHHHHHHYHLHLHHGNDFYPQAIQNYTAELQPCYNFLPSIFLTMLRCAFAVSAKRAVVSNAVARSFAVVPTDVNVENGPFVHFRPKRGVNPKFKSPRKRASKLFNELNKEMTDAVKEANPAVFEANVEVGDAVELEMLTEGGISSTKRSDLEKVRGVVIGMSSRGLATSIHIRDVVHGEPVERKICLCSPLVKSMTVLEKNFIYKGRRKVKRAKLYFLRERNPSGKINYVLLLLFAPKR
jgi:large subunit ribosomal protein L19